MQRLLTALTLTCLWFTQAVAAPDLPFRRFALDNGLVVIFHEDHSAPLVAVNLAYRVGSKDEAPGRTGFAHLFEHLMFMGTSRVPRGAFDSWMEAQGAWNNAWTSEDLTDYYEVGPSHALPLLLWLEADRLQMLGGQIDRTKLDLQRDVVRNERRQTSENTPYGLVELELPKLLFPAGHPYYHPVIGSHEDLQAASVDDVRQFFAEHYVPSNASLLIAGDFDPVATEAQVRALFGPLPSPPGRPRPKPMTPEPAAVRSPMTVEDRVDQPRAHFAWQTPAYFEQDDAALTLLASILAGGKASRLERALVYDQGLAQDVGASQASGTLVSRFVVHATAREGVTVERLEAALNAVLTEVALKGVTQQELDRARSGLETQTLLGLQPVLDRASTLNLYQALKGDPGLLATDLERYRKVTTREVSEVAERWLTAARRATLRVVPKVAPPSSGAPNQKAGEQ